MRFDEPHPSPKRSSPTRLNTMGQTRYKGWPCTVPSCVWVRNGVEILRGPRTVIKSFNALNILLLYSIYDICIILVFTLLLRCSSILVCWVASPLGLLACLVCHQQCSEPFFVSVCIIVGWSLWCAAALNYSFISDYRMESSQDLYTITDPNTAGYSEHIYYQHT